MAKDKRISLLKVTSMVIIINLLSKITGFIRDFITASKFGTSVSADAFSMSSVVPNIIFAILGAAIVNTFVPIFNDVIVNKGEKRAFKFSNNVITVLTLLSIILTLLGEIFCPQFVKLIAPDFHGYKYLLTIKLTRIFLLIIIVNTWVFLSTAILQAKEHFLIPSLIGIPYNLLVIVYLLFFSSKYGVLGLTEVIVFAMFVQFLIHVPSLARMKYRYKPEFNISDGYLKSMVVLLIPILLGTSVQQITSLFNGRFSSSLETGSVAALSYASRLNSLVMDIFVISIVTVIYPKMTKLSSENKIGELIESFNISIRSITIILFPIITIILIESVPIVKILFQRDAFGNKSTLMTSTALFYYIIGIIAAGLREVLCRMFYALKDTRTPMINSAITVLVNVVLAYYLKDVLRLGGIALASSIAAYVSSILLFIKLNSKLKNINYRKTIGVTIKVIFASIGMGIFLKVLYQIVGQALLKKAIIIEIIGFGGITLIALLIYMLILYLMKVEEINMVSAFLYKKIKRG
ncbi:putative peptidoglycan lipid II flippase [Clostridium acetobutylicum]|uniref:Probable lipid II flippase MurJ n=1 Tax=Clostridium acetobutylicum (strain ATCC 824 / DSM 792 / JCM 1419 / IAM 19013 / LMG 5710 / NBRC 13948 / NRRL B-527 / VKM B-1787 / 2291 / W) TaxID=272562 RepID=Q97ER1_CLOAB|nr:MULTISPECIES: murein biosynthesis integral membrane protein MurJ [Clostridium]AAK80987.1 Uncharacterized membrane protein, putative virulence factor MviN [Clostridium acetobutylicum ATCC 824]ADZ22090.1 Conserved hypothetical protein [Clostridium acetobutylicum EA 2018]AEI32664.1 hypothetical protein SMB_G3083 [Clostridium acetobutylicum DSM 1731]AWV78602.1 murein biosynthesis integral membrane protein MurJ [Clostridium acetobutylicum]MBC2393462.1 murein biosynthesis integral membrane protei